jgi:hypothetical protein
VRTDKQENQVHVLLVRLELQLRENEGDMENGEKGVLNSNLTVLEQGLWPEWFVDPV